MATQQFEFHKLANLLPLNEATIEDVAKDIKAVGQRESIVLYESKILDGRIRYSACKKLGIRVKTRQFNSDAEGNPVAFVLSVNLHRRHLTSNQKLRVAYSAVPEAEEFERQAKQRQKEGQRKGTERTKEKFRAPRNKALEPNGSNPPREPAPTPVKKKRDSEKDERNTMSLN